LKQNLDPIKLHGVLENLRRIISRPNETFRYTVTEDLIEFSPAVNLGQRFRKFKKQNMQTQPPKEFPSFMAALDNASISLKPIC